jgi:hypothetical protein
MYGSEEFDAIPITSSLCLDVVVSSYLDVAVFDCIELADNRIVASVSANSIGSLSV